VKSFPLSHSIPCCGFLFKEKEKPRHFRKEILKKYSITGPEIRKIKMGKDWIDEDGNIISNDELTSPPSRTMSYAYCTDTLPVENLQTFFSAPDILYHEATFSEEHAKRASETGHSTAKQAATIAQSLQAKQLIIGHFSVR